MANTAKICVQIILGGQKRDGAGYRRSHGVEYVVMEIFSSRRNNERLRERRGDGGGEGGEREGREGLVTKEESVIKRWRQKSWGLGSIYAFLRW